MSNNTKHVNVSSKNHHRLKLIAAASGKALTKIANDFLAKAMEGIRIKSLEEMEEALMRDEEEKNKAKKKE